MTSVSAFSSLAEKGLVGLFVGPVVMTTLLLIAKEWLERPEPTAD